mmetsp:Transcript_3846/g.10597  ORF Transcript_3846/g.10597 Transcript_3846/m.10597 type:complete len:87 (+) Transcript_3846:198-458(+)
MTTTATTLQTKTLQGAMPKPRIESKTSKAIAIEHCAEVRARSDVALIEDTHANGEQHGERSGKVGIGCGDKLGIGCGGEGSTRIGG